MSVITIPVEDSSIDFTHKVKCAGKLFDNGDREVNLDVLEELIEDEKYGSHWTKNPWWGMVWAVKAEDGTVKFREQIRQQGHTIALYEGDTVEELFQAVNAVHGWD